MSLTKFTNIGLELQEGVQNTAFQEDVEGDTSVASSSREHDTTSISVNGPEESAYTQIKPYAGMPKEVLMLHSSQACYRVPREILFWLIIACTLALIAMTIAIVALSPRCLSWWQVSPVYQVYLRSFKDSNADGIGDLKGIKEKLSHFEYLNIKAIWISPFYKSPMRDYGYDVEDFRQVDPLFGTMEDFDDLLASMHDKGLKLIMDYIPNHTSDKHIWFELSRNGTELYKDYYIWVNCTKDKPPNNWISVLGNSSWEYDEMRKQCYFHQFLKEQPDLNYRNPHVIQEMTDIIHFWLQKGVDGFRMDAVKHMLEATHLRNEPQVDPDQDPSTVDTEFELYHDYTYSQPGLHEILTNWRVEMDTYSREPGRHRLMVIESYDYEEIEKTMRYYGTRYATESDFPFNFYLLYLHDGLSGNKAKGLVDFWMSNIPEGKWPNWVVGNHDKPRIGSSAGKEYIRAINMLLLTLPGTPTTYYGEEIGMTNVNVSVIQDPFGKFNPNNSRDPQRTPMQWSNKLYAGFSDSETGTWLDIAPDYTTVNVEVQQADPNSIASQYRTLSLLRGAELALSRGWFCYVRSDANVFAYLREMDGYKKAFLVVLNFGKDTETDLSSISELPDVFTVHLSTVPLSQKTFSKSSITTFKGQGLLLEYSSNRRFHPNHASECFVSEKACYMDVLDILYRC
ncbi:neutral and basic amino acid transport protein rBAT-like [Xyrauchen texanus]|uniref:neutral and basic amino acid transport protein rBAT-like n=1 Tax=Xyrauchen texanus TaxID=154827 RepID=UPI002242AFF4|nr:neutral and basic amino acid transport protein rBAT-like [Xyrauchen texanus]